MPKPVAPETTILVAARNAIEASDLKTDFSMPDLKIRHARHRHVRKTEEGVAVRFVDAAVREEAGDMFTHSEVPWVATLDIIVDLELSPEPDDETAAPTDDIDVTGFDDLLAMARYCANVLVNPDEAAPMRQVVDDILPSDIDPDEDSTPDKGRLVISVVVLYRTRYDNLLELLPVTGNV